MIELSGSSYENFAEWLVLGLVVLATMSIGIEPESVVQDELEVTNLSGTITLATRASMDVLGLEDFDKGATANVNVNVQNIVSTDCENCTGILIQGPVNITDLTGGGSGRVEATIEVIHMREHVGDGLIAREWFSFLWDVTGGNDFSWDVMIVHSPPAWQPEDRYNAGFLDNETRTGPWILIDTIIEGTQVAQGCLPDRSMPCLISNPDVHLTSTLSPKISPTTVPHPGGWVVIENLTNAGNSTSKTEQLRDLMQLGEPTNHLQAWCIGDNGDPTEASAWSASGMGGISVAPMGIYLEALALSSPTFAPVSGTWTEVDFENRGCAALVDDDQNLRLAFSITEA